MTYIYSNDGTKKVDIDKATCLGDVARDLKIYQQGDDSQLWRSAKGSYFKGCCLDHAVGRGGYMKYDRFVPITEAAAKRWVIDYYGSAELERFGFANDAEEI